MANEKVSLIEKKAKVYDITIELEKMKVAFKEQASPYMVELQKLSQEIAQEEGQSAEDDLKKMMEEEEKKTKK